LQGRVSEVSCACPHMLPPPASRRDTRKRLDEAPPPHPRLHSLQGVNAPWQSTTHGASLQPSFWMTPSWASLEGRSLQLKAKFESSRSYFTF